MIKTAVSSYSKSDSLLSVFQTFNLMLQQPYDSMANTSSWHIQEPFLSPFSHTTFYYYG